MYQIIYSIFVSILVCATLSVTVLAQKSGGVSKPASLDDRGSFDLLLVTEINKARSNPSGYSKKLADRKKHLTGKILRLKNRTPFMMIEGQPVIDEAIEELKASDSLEELSHSPGLQKVAVKQLTDLIQNPRLGHYGKNGSDLRTRLAKYGRSEFAAENITYWDQTPEEAVLTMLIDDGVASRLHRKNLLDSRFTMIGTACGKGKQSRFICVVVLADKFENPARAIRSY